MLPSKSGGEQLRAASSMLGWQQDDLAEQSGIARIRRSVPSAAGV
jgi:hypothetical protein